MLSFFYLLFYLHRFHAITGLLFHQDVTATGIQTRVILTVLSSRRRAASAAACATTAATTGWGLTASTVDLSCTRIHRGGRTTRRPAYVRFHCCFLHLFFVCNTSNVLLMYLYNTVLLNSIGPSMEPCGTPDERLCF